MRHQGRHGRRGEASLALIATMAGLLLAVPAVAGQVAYPKAAPKIELNVPDDWAVSESKLGLEMEAPGKDGLVVAALLPRDKTKVNAWVQDAVGRMETEGVHFLKDDENEADVPEAATPSFVPPGNKTTSAGPGENFTFSGAPAMGQMAPPNERDFLAREATRYGLPASALATGKGAALSPFSHFYYKRTTMHGKPVDVELALYALARDQIFVIAQLSGPVDPRGVMIVRSLRILK